jgi:hypothetical protein
MFNRLSETIVEPRMRLRILIINIALNKSLNNPLRQGLKMNWGEEMDHFSTSVFRA